MAKVNQQKSRVYKGKLELKRKTACKELTAVQCAFVYGAIFLGGCKQTKVASELSLPQGTISKTVARCRQRAEDLNLPITDPYVYEDELRPGRPELLTQEQKDQIIAIVTQDQQHREKEPLQALKSKDFNGIKGLPAISTKTL